MIRGEYWIIDGDPLFACGDTGDTNHEGHALQFLRGEILSALSLEFDDHDDWREVKDEIPAAVREYLGLEEPPEEEDDDPETVLLAHAGELSLDADDIRVAFENGGDVRNHMAKTRGWITCHRNHMGTWYLTRDTVKSLVRGVGEILEQEGHFPEEGEEEDFEITIFVASSGNTYSVDWERLDAGDMSTLQLSEPPVAPNAQVKAMDEELELPYYRGKHS